MDLFILVVRINLAVRRTAVVINQVVHRPTVVIAHNRILVVECIAFPATYLAAFQRDRSQNNLKLVLILEGNLLKLATIKRLVIDIHNHHNPVALLQLAIDIVVVVVIVLIVLASAIESAIDELTTVKIHSFRGHDSFCNR